MILYLFFKNRPFIGFCPESVLPCAFASFFFCCLCCFMVVDHLQLVFLFTTLKKRTLYMQAHGASLFVVKAPAPPVGLACVLQDFHCDGYILFTLP